MSRHTHVNLLEIEDSVNGRVQGLEGRFGRTPMGARDIGISHFRYGPNVRSPVGHKHREQEEAYLVVRGSGQVMLDGELSEVREWGPDPCLARCRAGLRGRPRRAGARRRRRPEARGRRR